MGKGTNFTIGLPTGAAKQEEAEQVESAPDRSLHILVVDDDEKVLEGVTRLLKASGHTLDAASNGHDGLEKFDPDKHDLVMTDRAMPVMNGDQFAAGIKTVSPTKPVIMLTGFGDLMERSEETPPNVDLVVTKPVTMRVLREAVAKVMTVEEETQVLHPQKAGSIAADVEE